MNLFLCILYLVDQISAWVFLIHLFFYAGFYRISLLRHNVMSPAFWLAEKQMYRLWLQLVVCFHYNCHYYYNVLEVTTA